MKILWLYKHSDAYTLDKWLHLEYVRYLKRHPGIEIIAYGPNVIENYPDLAPIAYDSTKTLAEIANQFPFDVIIVNTKSRMFDYYSPKQEDARGCWLPRDFKSYPRFKVMIEEDYHYEPNDDWYAEIGFNLMIQHYLRI